MAEEVKKQNISGSGEETGGRETDQKIDSQKPDAQGKNAEHSEKTFTQDEVNTIISKRLAEQQKKMPGKEEMEAFKKWQEGQKTAEQKQAEQAEALRKMQNELTLYKNKEKVGKAGVDSRFAEYAVFEVSKLVDEQTDFDAALKSWIETNQQFKAASASANSGSTGIRQGTAEKALDGVEAEFKRKNPNLKF